MTETRPLRALLAAIALVLCVLGSASPARAEDSALFIFKNVGSGQCLDHSDWGRGEDLYVYDCHERLNQIWEVHCVKVGCPSSAYRLSDQASGLCLQDVPEDIHPKFAPCSPSSALQQWVIGLRPNDGGWAIASISTARCLDHSDWGQGLEAIVFPCHFGPNQLWTVSQPHPV